MEEAYEELKVEKEKSEQAMHGLLKKLQSMVVTIKTEADHLCEEVQHMASQMKLHKEKNKALKAQV